MDDAALGGLEHRNFIETLLAFASKVPDAHVQRAGGLAVLFTGSPLRLFNQVLVEDERATPEAIADAIAVGRARGDRFLVDLRRGTDDRFWPLMAELGLEAMSDDPFMPGMALHPIAAMGTPPADPTSGHDIRLIDDAPGIEDHIVTIGAGFELPEAVARDIVRPEFLDDDRTRVYVGYVDGDPVTTGLGYRTGRTIGVYNISTVPAHRRRGYGAAMTTRIVRDAAADGCDIAILQSSAMGRPVYERLGFRTVVDYLGFIDPPGPEVASGRG